MKKLFAFSVAVIFLFGCNSNENTTASKNEKNDLPNIVLLIGDDHGYPYFGFMGADYVQTPNMDKLATSGTLFTQGYVPDNHCRPSLATLLTGMLPVDYDKQVDEKLQAEMSRIRFESEEAQKDFAKNFKHHAMKYFETLPVILKEKGYNSFQGGKWWEYNYQNGGFTHGMTTGWTAEERKNGSNWFKKFMGGEGLQLARVTMEPVYEFIKNNKEAPFFIWYAPELPHYPFTAPDKYYNLYKDKDLTESAKRYYANCTWFDDGIGELRKYLKETGKFENTLFVYVNDNGWEQNPNQEFRHDSLRWHNGGDKGKLSIYDQSYRTPIIFAWQHKIEAGIRKTDLMHSADIPATILDYLGHETPEYYFGKSYKDVMEGKAADLREVIIGNSNKMRSEEDMMGQDIEGYWLRNQDWFFRWNMTLNEKALYDMKTDANNDHNVANEKEDLVKTFSEKMVLWKTEKGLNN